MTEADDNVNVDVAPAPQPSPPERKQEHQQQPEAQEIPEPRITNEVEGKKKQKEAAKRLSDYNKGVASRKMDQAGGGVEDLHQPDVPPLGATPTPAESENSPTDDFSESSMSVGNIIALAGVGVAILCLYLSYKPDQSDGGGSDQEPKILPKEPPSVPKAAKMARAPPRKTTEPKFRRL